MAMHKQMISLTEPQAAFLKVESVRLGISVSDLIRRIIDQHREGTMSSAGNRIIHSARQARAQIKAAHLSQDTETGR
jgi:hypothetical protein